MSGAQRIAVLSSRSTTAPPRSRSRSFTQAYSLGAGIPLAQRIRRAVAARLIQLADRISGAGGVVQIQSTRVYVHGSEVQATFDNATTPARILGGAAVFESSSTDAPGSVEPLPGTQEVYVRYQDVSKTGAPNVDLVTTCPGAVMQGNHQRSVDFVVTPPDDELPTAIVGKPNQLTVYLPVFPDTKRYLGVRLNIVPG